MRVLSCEDLQETDAGKVMRRPRLEDCAPVPAPRKAAGYLAADRSATGRVPPWSQIGSQVKMSPERSSL